LAKPQKSEAVAAAKKRSRFQEVRYRTTVV
jgi:hypothetical protein